MMYENIDIGWIQAGAVIISGLITLVTSVYIFYKLTNKEIGLMREQFNKMDERWEFRFGKLEDRFVKMDEKWERLFERLYFKENPKKKA